MNANCRILEARVFVLLTLAWALSGCGTGKMLSNPLPNNPPPTSTSEFLYVTANKQILGFTVNTSTGALTSPTTTPGPDTTLALSTTLVGDPAGKFLYALDTQGNAIVAFAVNPSTGGLTAVSGSPFAIPQPRGVLGGIAVDPAGKFIYVADTFGVAAFAVNSSTGALATVAGSPFTDLNGPFALIVSPSGKFAYASDSSSPTGVISGFALDSNSGALTPIPGSPFATTLNGFPFLTAIDSSGAFFYGGLLSSDSLSTWSIDQTTGSLTSTTPSLLSNAGLSDIAGDSTGQFLYASEQEGIFGYNINSTSGILTPIATSSSALVVAQRLSVDPSGKFLFVATPLAIAGFSIDSSSGALAAVSNTPFPTTTQFIPKPSMAIIEAQ
jgi:6-phosphogluconolactonase (cycloisomerase 2 family)